MATAERTLPIRWDLTGEDAILQGADWIRYHAFDYLNTTTSEVEIWDTTGYTARMTIRAEYGGTAILSLTTENGRLEVGGEDWSLKMHLTPAATAGLASWGIGVYDCEIVDEFGRVTRVLHGRAALSPEVTT